MKSNYGPYPAVVTKVVDGDTMDVAIDLGFNIALEIRARLKGIDAPEVSTVEGRNAKTYVRDLLQDREVCVTSYGWDKYGGRIDAMITLHGENVADLIVLAGHAKPYFGGKR